jgi:hypothetical protein
LREAEGLAQGRDGDSLIRFRFRPPDARGHQGGFSIN